MLWLRIRTIQKENPVRASLLLRQRPLVVFPSQTPAPATNRPRRPVNPNPSGQGRLIDGENDGAAVGGDPRAGPIALWGAGVPSHVHRQRAALPGGGAIQPLQKPSPRRARPSPGPASSLLAAPWDPGHVRHPPSEATHPRRFHGLHGGGAAVRPECVPLATLGAIHPVRHQVSLACLRPARGG